MKHILTVTTENARLDTFISRQIPEISRSKVRALIESGKVFVNGKSPKPCRKVVPGDEIVIEMSVDEGEIIRPQRIPLDIVYEDEHILLVNKPAGLTVHPAETVKENTLVNALLWHTDKLSSINGPARRGILHRLDKDTTGILIVAKTNDAHADLAQQMKARKIKKNYLALVIGNLEPEEGEINVPLGRHRTQRIKMSVKFVGGREAVTFYKVSRKYRINDEIFSFLKVSLKTGRTHQIRVHFSSIGHPVCGDKKYGKSNPYISMARQALHAEKVEFIHPATGRKISFKAPLPRDFRDQIRQLESAERAV